MINIKCDCQSIEINHGLRFTYCQTQESDDGVLSGILNQENGSRFLFITKERNSRAWVFGFSYYDQWTSSSAYGYGGQGNSVSFGLNLHTLHQYSIPLNKNLALKLKYGVTPSYNFVYNLNAGESFSVGSTTDGIDTIITESITRPFRKFQIFPEVGVSIEYAIDWISLSAGISYMQGYRKVQTASHQYFHNNKPDLRTDIFTLGSNSLWFLGFKINFSKT